MEKIANILLDIKAVELRPDNPFTYASGAKGPIYTDNRQLMGYPDHRSAVVDGFLELAQAHHLEYDVVAGTATAGIPHAAWIADRLNLPMIYIRGKAKGHGKGNRIEGKLDAGQRVLVIEDLVNSGGSSVDAVEAVREKEGIVVATLAIVTYGLEKAAQRFANAACPLYTLTNLDELLGCAQQKHYLNSTQAQMVLDWRAQQG